MNAKQIENLIRRYNIHHHDVILLRKDDSTSNSDFDLLAQRIGEAVTKTGRQNVVIIKVASFDDIRVLPMAEMNRAGWYRLDQIPGLAKRVMSIPAGAPAEEQKVEE